MPVRTLAHVSLVALWVCVVTESLEAKPSEQETLRRAAAVLDQIMSAPAQAIPRQLLSDAQAVAIVPQVKNGAFVVGIRKGRGVLVVREKDGLWRAPQFIEMTGGSIGWQAGVQSSDVILVFRSHESLDNLINGKLTIGADASVAAGPVGRQVAAATDVDMAAEIYSYSRSRGAFLGVSLDGTVIQSDFQADARFYRSPANVGGQGGVPALAQHLVSRIAQYTSKPSMTVDPDLVAAVGQNVANERQRQLVESSQRLSTLLDPAWQQYLALPQSIFQPPTLDAQHVNELQGSLVRYEQVAANPAYSTLTTRPEFQSVLVSLRQILTVRGASPPAPISLPPPPSKIQPSGPQFPR